MHPKKIRGLQNNKGLIRNSHVQARGSSPRAKRIKRLLMLENLGSSAAILLKHRQPLKTKTVTVGVHVCGQPSRDAKEKEPDLIFMVSKSGSLNSYPSTLSLPYGLPKNTTHGTMFV